MKNTWRKVMAAFCAASVLASIPGVSVYAADLVNEEMIEISEELPGEAKEVEELSEKDSAYEEPEIVEEAVEPSALDVATTDLSEEPAETVESVETDVPYSEDSEDAEETVGAIYTVGNGVQASFYLNSGRIMLFNVVGNHQSIKIAVCVGTFIGVGAVDDYSLG